MKQQITMSHSQNCIPRLSIIVPVYNVGNYLNECIESILAQKFRDWELILVDDGSTDNSPGICDDYAGRDSRIRVIHQVNSGRSISRNRGLTEAVGEYVGFVDSDDWIDPGMYFSMVGDLDRSGADIAVCGYWFEFTYGNKVKQPLPEAGVYSGSMALRMLFEDRLIQSLSCDKVFRRKVLYPGYPEGRDYYEDSAVMLYWFRNACSVVVDPTPYYHYRMRRSGVVNSVNPDTYFDKLTADISRADFVSALHIDGLGERELAASIIESSVVAAKKIARYCNCDRHTTHEYLCRIRELALPYYDMAKPALRPKTVRRFAMLVKSPGRFIFSVRFAFMFEFRNRKKARGCFA